ncbi:MAG: glycosyltransferase family 4 protein [Acetobacter aceti]|uniref:Glycosyl transferase n=1 Tax=Acetobacter aceti TaxID=435 RepID=A0A1U9KKI8_ACEAC|nr:glycosyltransferase family 4 protein [Acetobacter aceti]AQS86312.1 glycosyl transferase [Acetobacter aceti]
MKILEVTNVDFSLHHFLLPLMRQLRAEGHDVIGSCAEGPLLGEARAEGFRIIPVPMARSFSLKAQTRAFAALVRLIRQEKPDLVHAHMPISGLLARFAAKLCGVPCIAYTCHGYLFNQPGSLARHALSFTLEWLAGHITDIYLTVSQAEARDARRLHIHSEATPVGNGRDPQIYHPDPSARKRIRASLGVPPDRVVIVAVSRLVRHKGYPELLAAMESVPGAELWIVGERLSSDHGEALEPYFQRAHGVLNGRLRMLGYREDIPAVLAAADIFTLPSHFEGLPMSIIEAMMTGLPVVATDIRGPREQIVQGETGLLVAAAKVMPLAEALNRLVQDQPLRAKMGTGSRQRALSLFNESTVLTKTAALLTKGARLRLLKRKQSAL